ncbi:MAG: hypothetical protein U0232_21120 [Thermomicrobiales bacterium]
MAKMAAKSTTASGEESTGFTAEERAAMQERAREVKAGSRRSSRANKVDDEAAVLAKIAEMADPIARWAGGGCTRCIKEHGPGARAEKLWYGMPSYAQDGKVLCMLPARAVPARGTPTFGFNDVALLDDGAMWPTAYALKQLTAEDEARIGAGEEGGELKVRAGTVRRDVAAATSRALW